MKSTTLDASREKNCSLLLTESIGLGFHLSISNGLNSTELCYFDGQVCQNTILLCRNSQISTSSNAFSILASAIAQHGGFVC
jgi:hypothetical protein